jgi:uncharacterized RDD family membrane protein YckC
MANPYAPPQAVVADVATSAGIVHADPGTRLSAVILDALIMVGMTILPMLAVVLAAMLFVGPQGSAGGIGSALIPALGVIGAIVGIKVIRTDGSPASLGRIFWLRNVVNALLGIIPLYNMIEVLFIFGERRQCLHDKIADTIVVRA